MLAIQNDLKIFKRSRKIANRAACALYWVNKAFFAVKFRQPTKQTSKFILSNVFTLSHQVGRVAIIQTRPLDVTRKEKNLFAQIAKR